MTEGDNDYWYPHYEEFVVGDGAVLKLHKLEGKQRDLTVSEIRQRLLQKWGVPQQNDQILGSIAEALEELGYDLSAIAVKRGDSRTKLESSQITDLKQKERADLAEVLGGMTQERIRVIPEEDIFVAFQRKTTVAASEHGIDYIAFKFNAGNVGIFPDNSESIVLGESKYTSATNNLRDSCNATKSWVGSRLTTACLYPELTNIANSYTRRSEDWKRRRVLGFIPSIVARDEKLVVSSTVLYDQTVRDSTAVEDVQTIPAALTSHHEHPISQKQFEALLFAVKNLESFCESCYEDFRCE